MARKDTKKTGRKEISDADYDRLESVLSNIPDDEDMTYDEFKEYLQSQGIELGDSIFDRMKGLAEALGIDDTEEDDEDDEKADEEQFAKDAEILSSLPARARLIYLLGLNRRCKPMLEVWAAVTEDFVPVKRGYDAAFQTLTAYVGGSLKLAELQAEEQKLRQLSNEQEQKLDDDLGAGEQAHPLEIIAASALESLCSIYDLAISGSDLTLEVATMNMLRFMEIDQFAAVLAGVFDYDDKQIRRSIDGFAGALSICEDYMRRKLNGVPEKELKDPKLIGQIMKYVVSKRCNITADMILPPEALK